MLSRASDSTYTLRWQYKKTKKEHYTYGSREMLEIKAQALISDPKIWLVTIEQTIEVLKNTIAEEIFKDMGDDDEN